MLLKKKKEVIKASPAIHIENKITLLQRRAWNVMLANAYDDLPAQDEYSVNVTELMEALGYESTNQRHLKESLKALATCGVEWDILGKDGNPQWGVTTLLAHAEIISGVCSYSYSSALRKRLHSPKMYAKISLSMQNKFKSKHALALYELCVDYLDMDRHYGETPFIPLQEYRRLMGIPDDMYLEFKTLNKRIIKEPVAEINKVTDFNVDIEYKRQGRKIVAIKFKVQHILLIPVEDTGQTELFIDTEGLPSLVAELVKAGVHQNKARWIWSQGFKGVRSKPKEQQDFDDYAYEKLDLLQVEVAKGRVSDKAAWLIVAIRDNYQNPNYKKRQRGQRIQEQIKELETEVKKIKEEQGTREFEILEPLLDTDEMLQKAFQQLKESPLFDESLNKYADNIREGLKEGGRFAAGIRLVIKGAHAEKFDELNEYQERIEEIESQIMQLKVKLRG